MTQVKVAPLDNVVVFSLGSISLWSGRGRLQPDDLGAASEDLPPAAVASLGSKRLISREILVKLDKVKRKMHRACASTGAKFLNGYAVGVDKAEGLAKQLDQLVDEGNKLRQHLLDNFDEMLAQWHRENPEWAHILKAGTPEKESVHKRINFGWDAFMVRAPGNERVAQALLGASASLGSTLYSEIAAEASDFVKKSMKPGREKGSQRTAAPIRRLVEKLKGLQFLDHRIAPLTRVFDAIVGTIPTTGVIEGHAYLSMVRCAYVLADIGEMQRLGERASDGESIDALVTEIIGVAADAAVAVAREPRAAQASPAPQAPVTNDGQDGDLAITAEELFGETAPTAAEVPPVATQAERRPAAPRPTVNPMGDARPVLSMGGLTRTTVPAVAAPAAPPQRLAQASVVIDF